MEYLHSTRNGNEMVSSFEAIAEGLAKDGGLFVPNEIKPLKNWQKWSRYSYIDLATEIFAAVFPDWNKESLRTCVKKAYTDHFDTKEVTPLSAIGDAYLLELY
ncbi:MAG: threonine synthase, partial [Erysipelotrichaceae bacterium]|nr:threonine synthase [Erysipelotrichaceae bacterium]